MPGFPAGTVTFLFTDIEQSTRGWERDAAAARIVVERHLALIRQAVETHGGVHFKTVGDATQSAFATAAQGVAGALDAQRALIAEPWPRPEDRPRVRMALHTGIAEPRDGDYLAAPLNRLSRLLDTAHGEQILLSSTVAQLVRDSLPEAATLTALGEYRLRDILQPEEVFQLCHPDLRGDFPPLNTPGHLPHNLPTHPTPFLGREREVEETVALLLRPEVRLVTLTGPGGVGKTRLGLRVAAELLETFPDGVFLVDLARLTEPDLVPSATATALGLREQPGQSFGQTLTEYLREQRMLLLFDNFEHVLPASTLVADLLASSPGLKVLATSRARLGLQAEHEYRVEPMPVPDRGALPPLEELSNFDAVELFTSRARALRPSFRLTKENAPAVAEIVCQLDGLPLAIELAAARVKLLSPQALVDRLDQRLATLTGGARDLPARQRTLRDTIDWSYDLLAPEEQILFRRLSVFVGGWTIGAAEALAAIDTQEPVDALQVLGTLVDQSLVDERPTPVTLSNEPRYGMLETIHDFAAEKLAGSGEEDRVERAFEAFFIACTQAADEGLRGPDQERWLERLDADQDNLRAALGRSLERGDDLVALRVGAEIWRYWWLRGHYGEGRSWLLRALDASENTDPLLIAAAENAIGNFAAILGDFAAAEKHLQTSIALWRQVGDLRRAAEALGVRGNVALNRREYAAARALGEEALQIFRQHEDTRGIAAALYDLALVARGEGDYPRALQLLDESMARWTRQGDKNWIGKVVEGQGMTQRLAGDPVRARAALATASDLYRQLADRYGLSSVAIEYGHLAHDDGDIPGALAQYGEALRYFQSIGYEELVVYCLEFVAAAAALLDPPVALQLFGAAEAARTQAGFPPVADHDAKIIDTGKELATRAAGETAARFLKIGRALSLAEAEDAAFRLVALAVRPSSAPASVEAAIRSPYYSRDQD
jgi:predicted ATPase/class 3 adenylate cyclase